MRVRPAGHRPHVLSLVAGLIAAALMAGACSSSSEPAAGSDRPADTPTATPAADPTATTSPPPTATAEPTPTPTPTPTPPPPLRIEAFGESGLQALTSPLPTARPIGVTIDGILRAVSEPSGSEDPPLVWLPVGAHTVCAAPVAPGTEPVRWDDPSPIATELPGALCAEAEGTVAARPELFPGHLVVAHYGTGASAALGILGEGPPESARERVVAAAAEYEEFVDQVVPAFEFIVTVATAAPGAGDNYTFRRPVEEVTPYLEQIRQVGGVIVLDLQPGRSSFLEQAKHYESLLMEPDIHLALDPEWSMQPDERPGRVIGDTNAEIVNEVLDYLDGLVVRHGLPQKLLIVHQFQTRMIENRQDIADPPGIAVMFHVDGQGPVPTKYETYAVLTADNPYFTGFKVFFDEDDRVMSPAEVMALDPRPEYVSYQ